MKRNIVIFIIAFIVGGLAIVGGISKAPASLAAPPIKVQDTCMCGNGGGTLLAQYSYCLGEDYERIVQTWRRPSGFIDTVYIDRANWAC